MTNFFSSLGTEGLLDILKQSNDGTAIYTGIDLTIQFANNAMLKLWGKDESLLGKKLEDAVPELKKQPFTDILKKIWFTGETYEARNTATKLEIDGIFIISYFDFTYKPIFKGGTIYCILHTATDVSERVKALELVRKKEDNEQLINENLKAANEELQTLNEEFQKTNEELAAMNEEYEITNEQLGEAHQLIETFNQQLKKENTDLLSDNEGFKDYISDLNTSKKSLEQHNKELRELNDTIILLNTKISDSETSFINLIAQAPVAMLLVKGNNFIISMINKPMLELLGKDKSIIGKQLFDELPELDGQQAAEMLVKTFQEGIAHSEISNPIMLNRNGNLEQGFFNFNYTPFIENGKVTGVINMAVDVSPQVLAIQERDKTIAEKIELEEVLRKSEERLQGILETMAEGVGVIDANGQMVYANPMAQHILGLSESHIKDRTYDDPKWQNLRIDGTPLPSEEHPMTIMMTTRKPVHDHEICVQLPNKERIYISINAAPIFDTEGNLTGGIGTFMDVTARRMITQGKDDFISIASHELKTPVTALKASLQLLQRSHEKLSVDVRARLVDQSIKSLEKLSHLITDLLDTSRIDQGHFKLDKQPFALSELFDDCCSTHIQNSDLNITIEGDDSLIVEADNQQIGQVMTNLITNAIKYAPDSDEIIIKIEKLNDQEVKITVKDKGPGIPQEKLIHLFERYYRTDYQGQKFTGLGLGLYISADIIKNHGGRIGVESDFGNGSEFWFTLPL
ncbi:ATP-binding protein [Chryseobacterium aquaticum]|uniref:ATP-binding protein n=1 Tax=Chryseobacterium aquaticum TaxID=452084 RepID=UPI000740CB51|nr:ATP-binding protein [Chryseobacterium aquaticum]